MIVRWKLRLSGDGFDLSFLETMFTSDPLIRREGDRWFLSGDDIEKAGSVVEAHAVARPILARLNGIARLSDRRHNSVNLSGEVIDTETGSQGAVVLAGTINLRSRVNLVVVVGDSQGETRQRDEVRLAELTKTNAELARVAELLGGEGTDQDRLWRVFERIKDAVGSENAMVKTGLACAPEISAFRAWANRPDVSGDRARHEVLRGDAPRRAMNDAESWQFVGGLVRAWAFGRESGGAGVVD